MSLDEPSGQVPAPAAPHPVDPSRPELVEGVASDDGSTEKMSGEHGQTDNVKEEAHNEEQADPAVADADQMSLDNDIQPLAKPDLAPRGRGRAGRKRRNSGEEDESAYSDSESAYDESEESVASVESEEYDSADDDDGDYEEEEYGSSKSRRRAPPVQRGYQGMPPGGFYQQWRAPPMMPGMRPMLPMGVRPMAPYPQGHYRPPPMTLPPGMDPANLSSAIQQFVLDMAAKNKAAAAASAPQAQGTAEDKSAEDKPAEAKPEGDKQAEAAEPSTEENGKEKADSPTEAAAQESSDKPDELKNKSEGVKQNILNMLNNDPTYRMMLMQRLYMQEMSKLAAAGGQLPPGAPPMMMRPPMVPGQYMQQPGGYYPRPPGMIRPFMTSAVPQRPLDVAPPPRRKEKRVRQPLKYDGPDADAPIAARRATRSSARKVDFSKLYKEEEEVEAKIQQYAEEQDSEDGDENGGGIPSSTSSTTIRIPRKQLDDLSEIQPEIRGGRPGGRKAKAREAEEEEEAFYDEEEENGVESRASTTSNDEEPTINKILSHRTNEDGEEEFFVKFNGLSYLHTEWISKEEMLEAKMGGSRIKRFMSKSLAEHHYDNRHIFNPDYTQIDRIVYGWDHPSAENPKIWTSSYLVKWKSLPYEESSWEKLDFLKEHCPNAEDKIAEWKARPTLESRQEPGQLKIGHRPDKSSWQPMPESPVYKGGNSLRSYQLEGVNWLVYCWTMKQSCIIADEMGLGKTVQSVAFIDLIQRQFKVKGPFIVIAPLSTIPHWEREFAAWTDLNVLVYHGSSRSRDLMHEYEFYYKDAQDRIIPEVYRFDVLITTYEMALAGFETLQPIIWRAGIFDEAHRLKNRGSKAAEALSLFRLEHKVMLTGTPLQNNLEELFALLHFLQPQRFASEEEFIEEYGNLEKSEDVQRLQELLRPLMLRRLKEDVEKSIPVKEETVIEVELTALQKRYYRAILEKNFAFLTKGCRGNNAPNLVNAMMELRKCCIHPYLIKGAEDRILSECGASTFEDSMQCMIQASGKLVLVDKLLRRLREQGHKVLIFSQMTKCLDLLTDFLNYRAYPWERIDGAVKGEDRQAAIDRFSDPTSDSFVFLLCTRAGGVGINLTSADTVVIFDSDWNPQNDLQAQARCHRIGQQKSVKVYRLITRNTYEREMFDKAGMKLGLDRAILQRMNQLDADGSSSAGGGLVGTHAPQLSKKEVETLLKKGAYGLLMEEDEDAQRFCDEDIDQILSRRTQVIRHGGESNGTGAAESSLFSKATFAATADDFDVDMDDPNFWELWAKRLNMNPREMLAGSGQSVDEPRIRRQSKRIKAVDLSAIKLEYAGDGDDEEMTMVDGAEMGKARPWTVKERTELVNLLLLFGPNRLDKILPAFNRSRNDLVACIRALVKYCLEHSASTDRYLREDSEKLLLSGLDFDRSEVVDASTGKIDLLAAEGEEQDGQSDRQSDLQSRPSTPGDNSKDDKDDKRQRPYPNASSAQTTEFRSFLKAAPEGWLEALQSIAHDAVLRMQLVDFLRDVIESSGEQSLPVPPLPGATPAEGWGRKDDQAILLSAYRHGYGHWTDAETTDGSAVASATEESLSARFSKLVMAIVKRTQAAAKIAMHQASNSALVKTHSRRRRRLDEASADEDEDGDGGEIDADDEVLDEDEFADDEDRPKRGRRAAGAAGTGAVSPKKKVSMAASSQLTSVFWSRRDQQEFVKVCRGYGLPLADPEGDRDWTTFSQLGDFSASILRSPTAFDEFADIFLAACQEASTTRRRRRTKQEMAEDAAKEGSFGGDRLLPGELMAADEEGALNDDDDDDEGRPINEESEDEDFKAPPGTKSLTIAPTLSPGRARSLLETIQLLDKIRDPAFLSTDLEPRLSRARRLTILPRWWRAGTHDAAILRAVALYGFEREDLILADQSLPFHQTFLDLGKIRPMTDAELAKHSESQSQSQRSDTYASGRKRRSTRAEMAAKFRPDTLPTLGPLILDRSDADWPSLENLVGRVRKMYDMAIDAEPTAVAVDDPAGDASEKQAEKHAAEKPAEKPATMKRQMTLTGKIAASPSKRAATSKRRSTKSADPAAEPVEPVDNAVNVE